MFLQTYACINAVMHVLYMSMIEDKSWIEKVYFSIWERRTVCFLFLMMMIGDQDKCSSYNAIGFSNAMQCVIFLLY